MNPSARFRLSSRGLLLAMISTAFAGSTWADNARVEFAIGNVTATGSDGRLRQLARNAEVGSGDLIRTNNNGQVQIRYPDGAYVSLRPDTEYAIREYQFEGKTDGNEKGFFSLLKGTMRTVTGLVGRVNKRSYQIATPTATIGIRGTGGVISVDNLGNTSLFGTSGTWDVTPNTGGPTTPVNPGEKSTTTSTGTQKSDSSGSGGASSGTSGKGGTAVGGSPDTPIYSNGNDTTSTGAPALLGQDISPAVLAFELVGQNAATGALNAFASSQPGGGATLTAHMSSGMLTGYEITNSGGVITNKTTITGTLAEGSTAGPFTWGRIIGTLNETVFSGSSSTISTFTFNSNQGYHFVVGPAATAVPTSGNFTYNLAGATSPTVRDGSIAPGTVTSGAMNGTFTATGGTISSVSLGFTLGGASYSMSGSGFFNSSNGYLLSGSGTTTSPGGGLCSSSCTTSIGGGFSGVGGTAAGMVYTVNSSNPIGGAAVFK